MVDAATQRLNMVDSQVLTSDVTDRRILQAMRKLPRERFVPGPMSELAYIDEAVPVTPPGPDRRWLLSPRIGAKLLQLADIGADDIVLDIGAATGYSSAILAGMARSVIALESDDKLAADPGGEGCADLVLDLEVLDEGVLRAGEAVVAVAVDGVAGHGGSVGERRGRTAKAKS